MEFVDYPAIEYTIMDTNETEYFVRVALNNSAGLGEYSATVVTVKSTNVGKSANVYLCYWFHWSSVTKFEAECIEA